MHSLTASSLSCIKQERLLFENISFQLKSSELLLIEGSNGAGKSSLLRILTNIATPHHGTVRWNDVAIANHKHLHYIAHENGLKLGLTVLENITLLLNLYEVPLNNVDDALLKMQLHHQKNMLAKKLSNGQKRKLALLRLLLIEKPLWILDEPITALDKETQDIFFRVLKQHLEKGGMCVLTSHQPLPDTFTQLKTVRLSAC